METFFNTKPHSPFALVCGEIVNEESWSDARCQHCYFLFSQLQRCDPDVGCHITRGSEGIVRRECAVVSLCQLLNVHSAYLPITDRHTTTSRTNVQFAALNGKYVAMGPQGTFFRPFFPLATDSTALVFSAADGTLSLVSSALHIHKLLRPLAAIYSSHSFTHCSTLSVVSVDYLSDSSTLALARRPAMNAGRKTVVSTLLGSIFSKTAHTTSNLTE